jgi:hypothetical protein
MSTIKIIEIGNPQSMIHRKSQPISELINTKILFKDFFYRQGFINYPNVEDCLVKIIKRDDFIDFKVFVRQLSDLTTLRFYVCEIDNLYLDSIELFETKDWYKINKVVRLLSS